MIWAWQYCTSVILYVPSATAELRGSWELKSLVRFPSNYWEKAETLGVRFGTNPFKSNLLLSSEEKQASVAVLRVEGAFEDSGSDAGYRHADTIPDCCFQSHSFTKGEEKNGSYRCAWQCLSGIRKVNGSPIWIPWWSMNINQGSQVPSLISHVLDKPLDLLFFSLAELAEGQLSFDVFFLVFFLGVSSSSSSSSSVSEATGTGTS